MNTAGKINFLVLILIIAALIGLTFAVRQRQTNPAARFAWIPAYPGARLEDIRTIQNHDQLAYGYHFQVKDEGAAVRKFYESKLRNAGFTVIGKGGVTGKSWDLYAENADLTRSIDVNGNALPEGVSVGVLAKVR